MDTIKEMLRGRYGIERTPRYAANRCTARKTRGEECTACADVCPQKIYPYGKRKRPIWDTCVRCGLCASVCPARCITPPADRVNAYLLSVVKRRPLTIGCDRESHACHINVDCLAAVSWEQLAYAALGEGVALRLWGCGQCERTYEAGRIRENLERLRFFLGENRYARKVRLLAGETDSFPEAEETVSRRELFHFIGNLALDRACTALPQMEDNRDGGLFYRALLRDAAGVAAEGPEAGEKFGMYLPRFNERCYNCGYCVRACPNAALRMVSGGDSFTVVVEPWKCTGCGICQRICRVEGIGGIFPARVSHLRQAALGKFPQHLCAQCGTPVPRDGGSLCGACLSRKQRGGGV